MNARYCFWLPGLLGLLGMTLAAGAADGFHGAPAAAVRMKLPGKLRRGAAEKGALLYAVNCASCHGKDALGTGNVPSLAKGAAQQATEGELFWFIGKGSPADGMPPSQLGWKERWQVVAFVKSLKGVAAVPQPGGQSARDDGPAPPPPFTDYRFEKPGQFHKILASDLPPPAPSTSARNAPEVVPRPQGAWPKVPAGFAVGLFADGLDDPRLLRTAPNGDIFLAESEPGRIRVLRGLTADGKARQKEVFTTGLGYPYGIAFYPPGKDPRWVYIGTTEAVVRLPYKNGDLHATGPAERVADLHAPGGHVTRALQFSLDGSRLFVAVGSHSNVDDPDTTPEEKNRADILVMKPDGSDVRVYASGIRNAGGGIAVNARTGELWASVNERDGLGDNLVPDYITRVREGGFYGWPWWYMGGNQDPRHVGKHPELKDRLLTPDVLLQPHHASLELAFYDGKQFPAKYRGDLFAAQHGSWNRSVRTGYELIRVPLHQADRPSGDYEDFMTGFVVDAGHVWGRPVGVTVMPDGSLLVSDDGSGSIWRITYTGG